MGQLRNCSRIWSAVTGVSSKESTIRSAWFLETYLSISVAMLRALSRVGA